MTDQPHQPDPNDPPKLHIDADWKAEARAEKQKLEEQLRTEQQKHGAAAAGEIPPADFKTLVSTLVSQALLYMGAIPDPISGQRIAHLELAQHHIDLLGVLEEKTKGNLDEEEKQMLSQTLHELRMHYTQLAQQVAAHQARQAAQKGKGGAEAGGRGDKPSGPSIIDPSA